MQRNKRIPLLTPRSKVLTEVPTELPRPWGRRAPISVEPEDDLEGEGGDVLNVIKEARLRAEATSLKHLVTHRPSNRFCSICQQAKIRRLTHIGLQNMRSTLKGILEIWITLTIRSLVTLQL